MDLNSGYPYFLIRDGLGPEYDRLNASCSTEVIVLGGGISGALMAYMLTKKGVPCIVVDKRAIGLGSTAASTSLLQYELDVPLQQLSRKIGKEKAIRTYRLCSKAIDAIRTIAEDVGYTDFRYCSSVYFSHTPRSNTALQQEFKARKEAGFHVSYLEAGDLQQAYGLNSKEAILSSKAATIDAYKLTHFLHQYNLKQGCRVFENTDVIRIQEDTKGVKLFTDRGYEITAKQIVYASGYEVVEQIRKPIVKLTSTYAFSTERIEGLPSFFQDTVFWSTDDPYLYIREHKGRLIIGGRDENYYNPLKREALLQKKMKALEGDFRRFFCDVPVKPEFAWAGTFGKTKDGLPYIGSPAKRPDSFFALGFGGNGITFSALAAGYITKIIRKEISSVPEMFSFDR